MKQGQDGTVPNILFPRSPVWVGVGGLPREGTAPSPWCAEDTVGSGCLQPGCLGAQLSLCSEGECPESRGEPHPQLRVSQGWEAGSVAAPSQRQV